MNDNDKAREFVNNISNAKAKDLVFISKYFRNKKKSQKAQLFISSTIATMAGASIFVAYLFPEFEKTSIIIGSILFGVITVSISFLQRKRDENNLLRQLIKSSDSPTEEDLEEAENFRKEMIEALESEEK